MYCKVYSARANAEKVIHPFKQPKKDVIEKPKGTTVKPKKGLTSFVDEMSDPSIAIAQERLAKLLIVNNIDFNIIETNYFIDFAKEMRPAYKPPKTMELSTDIIDKLYKNSKLEKFNFEGSSVLLLSDQKNEQVIISMLQDKNGKCVFVNHSDYSTDLDLFILESMQIARTTYEVKVYGVVSNTTSTLPLENTVENWKYWYFSCLLQKVETLRDSILDIQTKKAVNSIVMEFGEPTKENLLFERNEKKNEAFDKRFRMECFKRSCST